MWRKEAKKSGESHRSHANVARDSQQQPPLANSNDAQTAYPLLRNNQMDTTPIVSQGASHNERSTTANTAPAAPSRSGGDRNWSARIRASIARLMDIDGVSLNPERFANLTLENQAAKEAQQAFRERVDRLQVASEAAHKEHWKRLRDVYPASTTKKMRFTIADHPSPSATTMISSSATPASYQPRHAALDALVVAAATEDLTKSLTPANAKRARHRHNLLSLRNGAGKLLKTALFAFT
ncbi:hypothetical protein L916_10813 [Phytophthora nicotianae]|uniref:Uncharacterized protein n=1 Tax=Phytophthora nicotianae TaxID=4792 RepID=W2ITG9_PHYNI|nr:hypothetical protein L916_10813 [Phytophthora nicotianae]